MTRTTLVSAAAALLAGVTLTAGAVSPAVAAANDPAKPKQEQQAQKADSRKYCIYTEATGSRIPKQQCRTRADWLADGVDPLEVMKQAR
jgi:hypothetical protein